MADAGELHQIAVAGGILRQHHEVIAALFFGLWVINRTVDDIHLIADDRLDACPFAQLEKLYGSVHHSVIRECQCRHP